MKKNYTVCNVRDLLVKWELIDPKKNLKYTEIEMVQLLDFHLHGMQGRLEKGHKICRELQKENTELKSPELWAFSSKTTQAPPEYRAEYLKRLRQKQESNATKVKLVKEPDSGL